MTPMRLFALIWIASIVVMVLLLAPMVLR